MKSRVLWILAAIVFLALAGWEAYNDLNGVPRAGFLAHANIVGIVLVPLWIASAVALVIPRFLLWRAPMVFAGLLGCLCHGAVLRVGRATAAGYSGGALVLGAMALVIGLLMPSIRAWLVAHELLEGEVAIATPATPRQAA